MVTWYIQKQHIFFWDKNLRVYVSYKLSIIYMLKENE